ncbi:DUF6731 family protein [Phascolarctobacterium faecium]|uniref:DUF6731 family protein n=1 Tax=Phascolarctobacterium faecium TaxID=33025 RepID=UPI003AB456DE
MGISRKIKMDYFTVCYHKSSDLASERDKSFDLCALIAKIDKTSLEDRMFEYYHEQARLDKFLYNAKGDYWFLSFTRLRETNIPSKARVTKTSESMTLEDDEFISEECSAIFDCRTGVLMLQRNIHSLSPTGINEYLNRLWGENDIRIYLRPIPGKSMIEKAKRADIYRKISLRFSDIDNKFFEAPEKSALKKVYNACQEFKCVNAEITITMGDNRKSSLNNDTIADTFKEIDANKDTISKAIIGVKETDDSKVEVIDLFEENMHDYVNVVLEKRVSLSSEYFENEMREVFENRKGEIYEIVGGIK